MLRESSTILGRVPIRASGRQGTVTTVACTLLLIREHDTGACPLLRRDLRRVPLLLLFITAGPIKKLCAWGGEDSGGHVLDTTSRGVCGLV